MGGRNALFGAVLILMAPLDAVAADLVVWWEKGFYEQEDEAVREIVAAFEQETGKHVELTLSPAIEIQDKAQVKLEAGQPPDFLHSTNTLRVVPRWAYEDRLTDLEGALGPLLIKLFDPDAVEACTFLNGGTGQRGLYALPMGRGSNHVHVWNSLLELAGFTVADIPRQWAPFWSFWCDQVQPALRRALGRNDIWGIGLPMSDALDTQDQLTQFQLAYEAYWFGPDGRLRVDDHEVRKGMVRALGDYTAIWRKSCTPPLSTSWANIDNNKAFLAQTVVMTANPSLSIPAALKRERPNDYYTNAVSIDWPDGANGQPLVIDGSIQRAVVFKAGRNPAVADEFVRFLIGEGWLAHWLDFAGDRYLPPMRKLVEQPFWLDPSDPHRMRAAVQTLTRPHQITNIGVRNNEWQSSRVLDENVWGKAVHRVVTEGITPEQAVDEAIARIKQILAE